MTWSNGVQQQVEMSTPPGQIEEQDDIENSLEKKRITRHEPFPSETIAGGRDVNEVDCCATLLTILSWIIIGLTVPFSFFFCFKIVQEYERAVIFRLGRLVSGGAKGPGIFFIVPCIDTYRKVDLRVVSFDVPPQEILTKDSVTVAVDAVVYFRISNPCVSITNVEDAHHSTRLLAQTTLRNVLGMKTLAEILADREHIAQYMKGMEARTKATLLAAKAQLKANVDSKRKERVQ
uniref:Band 7 domain-containing protein n=1 Tax=Plectus sambesii TaxID=2011161 RepID=A0A914WTB7_9BILA